MPTAAKLIAAVYYALLGLLAAGLVMPLMPPDTIFGFFQPVCAAIGAVCGWRIAGTLVGAPLRLALETGVRTIAVQVFYSVLGMAIYDMVLQSMKLRYDGPVEAVQAVFQISVDYLYIMLNGPLIATLLIGGAFGGVVAEWAAKRWR